MAKGQISSYEGQKRWNAEHAEEVKASRRAWFLKNKEETYRKKKEKAILRGSNISPSKIIEKHREEFKDDPESLSTDFMMNLVFKNEEEDEN